VRLSYQTLYGLKMTPSCLLPGTFV